jgi:hypothetical protein
MEELFLVLSLSSLHYLTWVFILRMPLRVLPLIAECLSLTEMCCGYYPGSQGKHSDAIIEEPQKHGNLQFAYFLLAMQSFTIMGC